MSETFLVPIIKALNSYSSNRKLSPYDGADLVLTLLRNAGYYIACADCNSVGIHYVGCSKEGK
jgi:hypothetical protein